MCKWHLIKQGKTCMVACSIGYVSTDNNNMVWHRLTLQQAKILRQLWMYHHHVHDFVMVCSLLSKLKGSRFAEPVCFYNFKESSSQLDVNLEAYLKLLTCVAGLFPNAYNLQWVLYESTDTSTSQIRTNQNAVSMV